MIVTKTPLRVSLYGGGSDLPEFYQKRSGRTLSFSTDLNIHIVVNKLSLPGFKLAYSELEFVEKCSDIRHPIIKECLKLFPQIDSIEIASYSDVAGINGTGLGSSSAFTVGLLNALSRFCGMSVGLRDLAEMAYHVERNLVGNRVGKQDQYGCALGGINAISYFKDHVEIKSLASDIFKTYLEQNFLLIRVDTPRDANTILEDQVKQTASQENDQTLIEMVEICDSAVIDCDAGHFNSLPVYLERAWELKKSLSNLITNQSINSMVEFVSEHGAYGVKLLGAGGGGFLLCHVPEVRQKAFRRKLADHVIRDIKISKTGTRVVYDDRQRFDTELF